MNNPTAKDMKNRFKADLIGWLNYISVYPEQIDSNGREGNSICHVFQQTMTYYCNQIELAKETLHEVIFYTLVHKEDYNTDFDIPKFENCMTCENYVDLIQHFALYTYLKRELWKLDRKSALKLLCNLTCEGKYRITNLNKIYIQLTLDLNDEKQFDFWSDVFISKISEINNTSQLYDLIMIIYDCSQNYIKMARRKKAQSFRTLHRLLKTLHRFLDTYSVSRAEIINEEKLHVYETLFAMVEMVKDVSFENEFKSEYENIESWYYLFQGETDPEVITLNHYRNYNDPLQQTVLSRSPPTLKEYMRNRYKENNTSEHEHVFISIVAYICQGSLPNQQDELSPLSAEEDDGMERLEKVVQKQYGGRPQLMKAFCNCVYIIRHRRMFWKSILKVIAQFLDLWIGVIEEAWCADIFSSWMSHEHMLPALYKHVLKHVQHYKIGNNSTTIEVINKCTRFLEKCFENIETNEELLIFRDHVFHNRGEEEEVHMPILGSTSFWNIPFDQEMIKVANQITSVEQDVQVPDDTIRRLIKLSIIWPYEVLRQLFLSSIENKNQYKAIIPVLHSLSNLSTLTKRNGNKSVDEVPLLLLILKETLSPVNSDIVRKQGDNIIQFIKACCAPVMFQSGLPLILMPNSIGDQALLPLQSVLNKCILQNLCTSCHIIMLEFSLHALNVFCESSLNDWTTLLNSSDLPAFLYCSPETYLISLTDVLALRSSHDGRPRLPLQVWESALKIIYKFFDLIQFALKTETFPRINQFFTDTLKHYDWKTQLIWYNVTRGIKKHSLNVPSPFFRITGALDDLFLEDGSLSPMAADVNEGWYEILTACRLSSRLTDELFEHKDQWTYNLLLLWNHPNEDTLLLTCFEQVLHPKTSLSVSIEYPSLLVHFLSKLYMSFPDAHQVILDYNGYDNAQMLPIIRELSHVGTKQYFIILYTTLLIRNQIRSSSEEDKQNNYFVLHLVNLLQGLTNWGKISQATNSYNELKAIGAKLIPCRSVEPLNTLLGAQSELDEATEVKTFYYPLLSTAELISDRALSILTLFHICSILPEVKDEKHQQSMDRFVMLIMEGLIDMPSQQLFQRMLQQQPKSRSKLWRQKKSNTKFIMKMRPIISEVEENLLRPVIERLPNCAQILQALGLTGSHKEQQKKPYLYFLN